MKLDDSMCRRFRNLEAFAKEVAIGIDSKLRENPIVMRFSAVQDYKGATSREYHRSIEAIRGSAIYAKYEDYQNPDHSDGASSEETEREDLQRYLLDLLEEKGCVPERDGDTLVIPVMDKNS